jgi:PAS domain S-box-containing protein
MNGLWKDMETIKYKILLAEDDKLDQMAFKRIVEEEKYSFDYTIAGSVSEAIKALNAEKFDVVLSDYLLGDGTAIDILYSIKKSVPFIIITGAGDEETAVRAMKAGAYDYLVKDQARNYLKTVPITIENAINHKRMEDKLKLLSHAIMSTDDSIYITDMKDNIIFVNRAFCETYGYSEEEIIGKNGNILWEKNPSATDTKKVYQAVTGWEVGFYHIRKNGSEFPVSLTRSVIKDEEGNEVAIVSVARDISERIRVEDQLRTENMKLKKMLKAKESMVSPNM